jgi:murein DD-endopeptidase MepM/ murein hydrolase activator NlpD
MAGEIGIFALQSGWPPQGIHRKLEETLRMGAGGRGTAKEEAQKQKVAEEFTALLLFEVIKAMRATIPRGGLFEQDSLPRDTYTALADMEVARAMAKREAVGLEGFVERALEGTHGRPETRGVEPYAPTAGVVSSAFGPRPDPLQGRERFHKGVDIAAPAGSPVKAMASGKVVFSGWAQGYGNLVTLDHGDGTMTRYAHNGANLVSTGERVVAGQDIALVGTSGRSTGPHLHFEVLREGQPVDPMSVISNRLKANG